MKFALLVLMILVQPVLAESISSEGDAHVYQAGGNYYGEQYVLPELQVPKYDFEKLEKLRELLKRAQTPEMHVERLKKEGWCEYHQKKGLKRLEQLDSLAIIFEEADGTGSVFKSEKPVSRQELGSLRHSGDVFSIMTKCEKESVPSA